MLKSIKIKNFKSVQDLEIELGRVNVFIGENGCGKTSILEAIGLASAAISNKLDQEFLVSRGIRVSEPRLMKSAFSRPGDKDAIQIKLTNEFDNYIEYLIDYKNKNLQVLDTLANNILSDREVLYSKAFVDLQQNEKLQEDLTERLVSRAVMLKKDSTTKDEIKEIVDFELKKFLDEYLIGKNESGQNILSEPSVEYQRSRKPRAFNFESFLIYTPENYFLRRFEEEGQISPIGVRGEGLFKHLVELFKTDTAFGNEIDQNLKLISWFEGIEIPPDLAFTEMRLNIKDRFLKDTIDFFDQRSANEGFLYLLFYFTLFLSKETPEFFAIDNIDNALNPKLCKELVQRLTTLAKEKEKQVILTTHNPSILDGIDLKDDDQRLFVIFRNADGHTKAKRVKAPKDIDGIETVRLSEAFIRGYIGGLPKNF